MGLPMTFVRLDEIRPLPTVPNHVYQASTGFPLTGVLLHGTLETRSIWAQTGADKAC